MHWNDAAIILSARKYGESSAVVRVLAREHGVFAGVARGANSKNNRGIIQSGNVVSSHWQARLSQQLGSFRLELLEAHVAHIMHDAGKLAALTSACAITELALPERHPYPKLFLALHEFLHVLNSAKEWQEDYIKYELTLLAESGFGLDLSECAATGRMDELIYVSPKSGRAVSKDAGLPYHERMLPLPAFLIGNRQEAGGNSDESSTNARSLMPDAFRQEVLAGLQLTGYFLEHSLLVPHGKTLPVARTRLYNLIKESDAA